MSEDRWARLDREVLRLIEEDERKAAGSRGGLGPISSQLPDFLARIQAAREQRRAEFTGDCDQCFDQPRPCNYCQRGIDFFTHEAEHRLSLDLAAWQEASQIPQGYRGFSLESFPDQAVAEHFKSAPRDRWMLVCGSTGVGKTGILCALATWRAKIKLLSGAVPGRCRFSSSVDLFNTLRSSYNDGDTDAVLRRYTTPLILIIDDLGAERSTEWATEQLYNIINHRYSNNLLTWISTNLPVKEGTHSPLADAVGDRTFWRIYEAAEITNMAGPNLRARPK